MNKKDALTLACIDSHGIDKRCADCLLDSWDDCVNEKESKYYGMDCINAFVQNYKNKADIPDGWDILKELFNKCKGKTFKLNIYNNGFYYDGFNDALDKVMIYIEAQLQQAGIEVNNV